MFTILLHSSKTTRQPEATARTEVLHLPALLPQAEVLAMYLKSLSPAQLQQCMKLSVAMANKTYELLQRWQPDNPTLPAIDLFLGDIYSGLQTQQFSGEDRVYANECLFILSGLYGAVRALDEIQPYRLEMGYRLPGNAHDRAQPDITSLYAFWGDKIAKQLPAGRTIINLSAVEYTKAVFPYLNDARIISPKFLTLSPKTGQPLFVTVHAKVARGAFACWLVQYRIEDEGWLKDFAELGYRYNEALSTSGQPVFVAEEFKGIGLSVRLT